MPPVTSIVFTDDVGAATLTNGKPFPANRFANWTPISRPIGGRVARQSDGAITMLRLRSQYGASFELPLIPSRTTSSVRLVDIADRLIYHLLNGGTCTVNTGDSDTAIYTPCGLMPGTEPSLALTDSGQLEYTLTLALINLDSSSPAKMVANYDA